MKPNTNSPNDCWNRAGYTVQRNGKLRTIYDNQGNAVIDRAGYDGEIEYCRKHCLMVEVAEK